MLCACTIEAMSLSKTNFVEAPPLGSWLVNKQVGSWQTQYLPKSMGPHSSHPTVSSHGFCACQSFVSKTRSSSAHTLGNQRIGHSKPIPLGPGDTANVSAHGCTTLFSCMPHHSSSHSRISLMSGSQRSLPQVHHVVQQQQHDSPKPPA